MLSPLGPTFIFSKLICKSNISFIRYYLYSKLKIMVLQN